MLDSNIGSVIAEGDGERRAVFGGGGAIIVFTLYIYNY